MYERKYCINMSISLRHFVSINLNEQKHYRKPNRNLAPNRPSKLQQKNISSCIFQALMDIFSLLDLKYWHK